VVGCTIGSRGEAPEERKPEIKDDGNNNNNPKTLRNVSYLAEIKYLHSLIQCPKRWTNHLLDVQKLHRTTNEQFFLPFKKAI
jgi:hypothetical protein